MQMQKNRVLKRFGDLSAYAYVAPAAVIMAMFIVYPLFSSLQLSTLKWNGLSAKEFIGLQNYANLFRDPVFWNSVKLQFIWALLSVVVLGLTGMVLAIIVEYYIPVKRMIPVFRTVMFMPMMMSLVAIGLLWTMIYNPMIGLLNNLLKELGMLRSNQVLDLLGNRNTALYAAFIPAIWQWSGFGMVIFSASMQGIPHEIMEASVVDGCTRFKQIRHIVFPLLLPKLAMVCTINLIGGLKCFDLIYVMTAGGPGISTQVSSIFIFRQAFTLNAHGYSAAASSVMFLLTTLFGVLFFFFTSRMESSV